MFQAHGVSADGTVVLRKKLRRAESFGFFAELPPLLIGMEACGGAHHWARELAAFGHEVRLMPPTYVKPYVKRGKTDAADAEAICEAVTRPIMRFAGIKTVGQQAAGVELKVRQLLIRQRTRTVNALRGHLAEFGIVAAKGIERMDELTAIARDPKDSRLPETLRDVLEDLVQEIEALNGRIKRIDQCLARHCREDETARRLATIPGVGPVTACALPAMVVSPQSFKSGRHFAAWLGLTPRSNSSGGKERLGPFSKQGNKNLRSFLVLGAIARLRKIGPGAHTRSPRSDPKRGIRRDRYRRRLRCNTMMNAKNR